MHTTLAWEPQAHGSRPPAGAHRWSSAVHAIWSMEGAGGGRRLRRASLMASGSGSTAKVTWQGGQRVGTGESREMPCKEASAGPASQPASRQRPVVGPPGSHLLLPGLRLLAPASRAAPHPHAAVLGACSRPLAVVAELQQHHIVAVALQLAHLTWHWPGCFAVACRRRRRCRRAPQGPSWRPPRLLLLLPLRRRRRRCRLLRTHRLQAICRQLACRGAG